MRAIAALLLLIALPAYAASNCPWGSSCTPGTQGPASPPLNPAPIPGSVGDRSWDSIVRLLDNAYVPKRSWRPSTSGYVVVSAVKTAGAPGTCDKTTVGTYAYFSDTCPVADVTIGPSGGCVGVCAVTNPGDDAAGGEAPAYAFVGVPNPPDIWLETTSGVPAGKINAVAFEEELHLDGPSVALVNTAASACVQTQMVASNTWPPRVTSSTHEEVTDFSFGMDPATPNDIDSTTAFVGLVNADLGANLVITNSAVSAAAAVNLNPPEDGYGFLLWTGQMHLVGLRNHGTKVVTAITNAAWTDGTARSLLATTYFGLLRFTLRTVYTTPGSTDTSPKQVAWKIGYPFASGTAASVWTRFDGPITGTPGPQSYLVPTFAICKPAAATHNSQLRVYGIDQISPRVSF